MGSGGAGVCKCLSVQGRRGLLPSGHTVQKASGPLSAFPGLRGVSTSRVSVIPVNHIPTLWDAISLFPGLAHPPKVYHAPVDLKQFTFIMSNSYV